MKHFILIFGLLFTVSGCSSDDNDIDYGEGLIGTWKLVEVYLSDGGSQSAWVSVKNGYVYTFKNNGTFTSSRFEECNRGKFEETEHILTLIFDCEEFTAGIEDPEGTFVENLKFENNHMILSPAYMSCVEGCSYKFKKIASQ